MTVERALKRAWGKIVRADGVVDMFCPACVRDFKRRGDKDIVALHYICADGVLRRDFLDVEPILIEDVCDDDACIPCARRLASGRDEE
jgi:hypothetical protein